MCEFHSPRCARLPVQAPKQAFSWHAYSHCVTDTAQKCSRSFSNLTALTELQCLSRRRVCLRWSQPLRHGIYGSAAQKPTRSPTFQPRSPVAPRTMGMRNRAVRNTTATCFVASSCNRMPPESTQQHQKLDVRDLTGAAVHSVCIGCLESPKSGRSLCCATPVPHLAKLVRCARLWSPHQ